MVEDSDCEEETDQAVCIPTAAKAEPMLSVGVHTKLPSD